MKIKTRETTKRVAMTRRVTRNNESGFTILETAIALVLMVIVGLGAASLFFYAARNSVSAGDRELAMAVAQQRIEQLRNVDFSDASLAATAGASTIVRRAGRQYTVRTVIVDSDVVNGQATTKTITIWVRPDSDASSWARTTTSIFGSVTLVSQRTALTPGPNRLF